MPWNFGWRMNRVTKKITAVKNHVNVPEKEHLAMTDNGNHVRDVLSNALRKMRQNGATNKQIRREIALAQEENEIIAKVTKNPYRWLLQKESKQQQEK